MCANQVEYGSLNKFCYEMGFSLLNQSQKSRSVLQDGSKFLELFWKEKFPNLITEKYGTSEDRLSSYWPDIIAFLWLCSIIKLNYKNMKLYKQKYRIRPN